MPHGKRTTCCRDLNSNYDKSKGIFFLNSWCRNLERTSRPRQCREREAPCTPAAGACAGRSPRPLYQPQAPRAALSPFQNIILQFPRVLFTLFTLYTCVHLFYSGTCLTIKIAHLTINNICAWEQIRTFCKRRETLDNLPCINNWHWHYTLQLLQRCLNSFLLSKIGNIPNI